MIERFEPRLDHDGYPSNDTLLALTDWPLERVREAFPFLAKVWRWPDFVSNELRPAEASVVRARAGYKYWRFATGGWSGNESLITCFRKSPAGRFSWALTARGGLYIFEEPKRG